MPINSRTKGAEGEREICRRFNNLFIEVDARYPTPANFPAQPFQRNQNQTAVGGSDISNPFGLSIEVKRVQVPAVDAWWKQCLGQAKDERRFPLLVYRSNRKPWMCRIPVSSICFDGARASHYSFSPKVEQFGLDMPLGGAAFDFPIEVADALVVNAIEQFLKKAI